MIGKKKRRNSCRRKKIGWEKEEKKRNFEVTKGL
jgi:hypothetical protein